MSNDQKNLEVPQPEFAAAPPTVTSSAGLTAEQVPFVGHWIIKQNGKHVQIGGWWNFPTKEAAQSVIDNLPATT